MKTEQDKKYINKLIWQLGKVREDFANAIVCLDRDYDKQLTLGMFRSALLDFDRELSKITGEKT